MNPFRFLRNDGSTSPLARITGLVGILLVGLLVWLSADPEAHERFHPDAGKEDHHCVVTEFAAGEAYYLAPVIELRPTEALLYEVARSAPKEVLREPVAYVLLPTCGPPSLAA
jgi:hypothetical protein